LLTEASLVGGICIIDVHQVYSWVWLVAYLFKFVTVIFKVFVVTVLEQLYQKFFFSEVWACYG